MSYSVQNIRNVCLVGHSGNGKTALAESLLFMTGAINRMGNSADGNTVCDYDPEEIRRQISISTAVAPIEYNGCKINVLDTPGYFDFVGEVIEAVQVADAAIIVCSAKAGMSVGAEKAWKLCQQRKLPRLLYISKTDEENSDYNATFNALRESVRGVEWKVVGSEIARLREIKDEDELALIRQACRITGEAFERILPHIKEGVTEKELALRLDFDMMSHGASKPSFSTIVAAGANGSLPHAVPGEYRLRRGDMITMDFGARYGNYCADMTRTVALGQPSDEMKKVYGIVLDAQKMAQDAVAAGKLCRDIDAIARNYIYSHGYEGRFGHGLGHSVGIDIHEDPRFNQVSTAVLKAGQVMTVEPGIYLPGVGGVRIENSVVVREGGCEVLTFPDRELIIP